MRTGFCIHSRVTSSNVSGTVPGMIRAASVEFKECLIDAHVDVSPLISVLKVRLLLTEPNRHEDPG